MIASGHTYACRGAVGAAGAAVIGGSWFRASGRLATVAARLFGLVRAACVRAPGAAAIARCRASTHRAVGARNGGRRRR